MKTKEEKQELIEKYSPESPVLKNCLFAFLVGGALCAAAHESAAKGGKIIASKE